MGFCTSCGELAKTIRCPRCKGKVSSATASGLSNREAWSATYLDKDQTKVYAPNLNKLVKEKSVDTSLSINKENTSRPITPIKPVTNEDKFITKNELDSKSTSRDGICFKCSSPLNIASVTTIEFNSKYLHRLCFTCQTCSIRLDSSAVEIDGKLICKDCNTQTNTSSNSSPSIITPEDSHYDLETKNINTDLKTSRIAPLNRHRYSLSLSSNESEKKADISDNLKLLNLDNKSKTANFDVSNLLSPSYSKSFQNLQASINNNSSAASSIRARPRKTSESSGTLSFADLMANRKAKDSNGGTFSRRPISMISLDAKSKRSSLPVHPKGSALSNEYKPPLTVAEIKGKRSSMLSQPSEPPSVPLSNQIKHFPLGNRLSLNRSRPVSLSFPKKQTEDPTITEEPEPKLESASEPKENDKNDLKEEAKVVTEELPNKKSEVSSPISDPESKNSVNPSSIPTKLNCSKCNKSILDTWFRLLDGRVLHRDCFNCRSCGKVFEDGKYSVYNDEEYHAECLLQMTLSPMSDVTAEPEDLCDRCNAIITGPCFTLTNGCQYHPKCFICFGCKKQFEQGTYVSQDGKEYHRECLPKKDQIFCNKCKKSIEGVFVTNNGLKFHTECFKCTGCRKVITPDTPFGEVSQQPYCEPCLIQQHTSRQASFALSAARQEERRGKSNSFSLQS